MSRTELTPRQLEVTRLVADDLTNREIAESLDISLETVKQHVSAAMAVLGVQRREQLGDWYHARHRSGLRRLRAAVGAPVSLLLLGGGAAAAGVAAVFVIATVSGIESGTVAPHDAGGPTSTTDGIASDVVGSATPLTELTAPPSPAPRDPESETLVEIRTPDGSSVPARELLRGAVSIFAAGQGCGTFIFDNDDGDYTLGLPAQPEACRSEGAELVFVRGDGVELFTRLAVVPGSSTRLTNFAPVASSDGPLSVITKPIRVVFTAGDPGESVGGLAAGRLTVLVDGVNCGSFSVPVATAELTVLVGDSRAAAACQRLGGTVTFEDGSERTLHETFTLVDGEPIEVTLWLPGPLDSSEPADIWVAVPFNEVTARLNDDAWEVEFRMNIQAVAGALGDNFGISYAVCEVPRWCGPALPHHFGAVTSFPNGESAVESVAPLADFESRQIGGAAVATWWGGDDPSGLWLVVLFDSTETLAEVDEENNRLAIPIRASD